MKIPQVVYKWLAFGFIGLFLFGVVVGIFTFIKEIITVSEMTERVVSLALILIPGIFFYAIGFKDGGSDERSRSNQ